MGKKEKQGVIWQLKTLYSSRHTDLVTKPALLPPFSFSTYSSPSLIQPTRTTEVNPSFLLLLSGAGGDVTVDGTDT